MNCVTLDEDDPEAGTADLLMQNHDRFFVDTGGDFCAFSHAAVFGDFDAYLAAHPETKTVLDEMTKPEASVLTATYWSVLPYACGPETVVKYRLRPASASDGASVPAADPHYLKTIWGPVSLPKERSSSSPSSRSRRMMRPRSTPQPGAGRRRFSRSVD